MRVIRDSAICAAAKTVVSPGLSHMGATSTTSAPTTFKPDSPSRIVKSSRVDHPPTSAVPVAYGHKIVSNPLRDSLQRVCEKNIPGAKLGSRTSMSTLI